MFQKLNKKVYYGLTLAVVVALLLAPLALADTVVNNIDTTIDPTLETRTIASGDSTVVGFFIAVTNGTPVGDPNGCNATGSDPATVTLAIPAGVSASANSLVFTGCGVTQNVTFSSSTPGSYIISVSSVTGGKPDSLWSTAPASFTLVVNPPADSTPPSITPNIVGTLGNNGWYVNDVTVSWSVVDNESAIGSSSGCDPITISTDTDETTLTCTATSAGGTSSESVTIKRDATEPTLSPSVSPNLVLLNGSANASANASDATNPGSGLYSSSCDSVDTSNVGTHSVTCYAEDNAGNTNSASASYRVIYNWSGFFQPVDNPGETAPFVFNKVKAGSGIPVKFSLSGDQGLGIFSAGSPASYKVNCDATAATDMVETLTAGQSGLSYDASSDQYNYVWKTDKAWGGTCRRLDVNLIDGTLHQAYFNFTK